MAAVAFKVGAKPVVAFRVGAKPALGGVRQGGLQPIPRVFRLKPIPRGLSGLKLRCDKAENRATITSKSVADLNHNWISAGASAEQWIGQIAIPFIGQTLVSVGPWCVSVVFLCIAVAFLSRLLRFAHKLAFRMGIESRPWVVCKEVLRWLFFYTAVFECFRRVTQGKLPPPLWIGLVTLEIINQIAIPMQELKDAKSLRTVMRADLDVGQYIEINSISGKITSIGLKNITLITANQQIVIIPNEYMKDKIIFISTMLWTTKTISISMTRDAYGVVGQTIEDIKKELKSKEYFKEIKLPFLLYVLRRKGLTIQLRLKYTVDIHTSLAQIHIISDDIIYCIYTVFAKAGEDNKNLFNMDEFEVE